MLPTDVLIYVIYPYLETAEDTRSIARVCKQWWRAMKVYLQRNPLRIIDLKLPMIEDIYSFPAGWPGLHQRITCYLRNRIDNGILRGDWNKFVFTETPTRKDVFYQSVYFHVAMHLPILEIKLDARRLKTKWTKNVRCHWKILFDGSIPRDIAGTTSNSPDMKKDFYPCMKELFQRFTRHNNVQLTL